MSLNCKEIEKIIETFPQNSRIISIHSNARYSISLLIVYNDKQNNQQRSNIVINTQSNYNRIFLDTPTKSNNTNQRFAQKLDSLIAGYSITKIYQFQMSRIVILQIQRKNLFYYIVARLWNTRSNILLTDKQYKIIDSLNRYSKIGEWPGEYFSFPSKKECNYTIRKEFQGNNINILVKNFFEKKINDTAYSELKSRLLKHLINKEIYINHSISNLNNFLKKENPDHYLRIGELLKINFHSLKIGMGNIKLLDYDSEKEITIKLDAFRTPSQNIEKYFKKYKKSKNAIGIKKATLTHYKQTLQRILKYKTKIEIIASLDKLKILENEINNILNIPLLSKQTEKKSSKQLGRHFILGNNFKAIVSKNDKEADQILKQIARGNDYWFHIRDFPGSHVIVKREKSKEIDQKTKLEAAQLAVYYSKARNSTIADVMFTMIKYIHKNKNTPAGLVFPTQEKNIRIKPNNKIIKEIFLRE